MRPSVIVFIAKGEVPQVKLRREEIGWIAVSFGPVTFSVHPDAFEDFRAAIAEGLGLLRADPVMVQAIEAARRAYEKHAAPLGTRPLA